MILSMTGFGRGTAVRNGREITVELRSVNSRYFEYSSRIPRTCSYLDSRLKKQLNERISRGKVELSMTDARSIGIVAPVRESGDVAGSAGCKLVGPAGEVEIGEGVIIAKRHIHMTPADAAAAGVADKDIVKVVTGGNGRKLVFDDVVIRVSEKFATAMHIDTDESNAAGGPNSGEIIK